MTRVQIPAFTDSWMRGDRYGEIVKIVTQRATKEKGQHRPDDEIEIAYVKLDKSGRTKMFVLADCEVI